MTRANYRAWSQRFSHDDGGPWHLEVRREQRLSAVDSDGWVTGSIDRLVLLTCAGKPIAAEIIDFKTDQIPPQDTLQRLASHYRPQLQAYARGVIRMLQLPPTQVSAKLAFLSLDQVVSVTE